MLSCTPGSQERAPAMHIHTWFSDRYATTCL